MMEPHAHCEAPLSGNRQTCGSPHTGGSQSHWSICMKTKMKAGNGNELLSISWSRRRPNQSRGVAGDRQNVRLQPTVVRPCHGLHRSRIENYGRAALRSHASRAGPSCRPRGRKTIRGDMGDCSTFCIVYRFSTVVSLFKKLFPPSGACRDPRVIFPIFGSSISSTSEGHTDNAVNESKTKRRMTSRGGNERS
jgi:hypothetical protein